MVKATEGGGAYKGGRWRVNEGGKRGRGGRRSNENTKGEGVMRMREKGKHWGEGMGRKNSAGIEHFCRIVSIYAVYAVGGTGNSRWRRDRGKLEAVNGRWG